MQKNLTARREVAVLSYELASCANRCVSIFKFEYTKLSVWYLNSSLNVKESYGKEGGCSLEL